jgi:hypothetical protein
MRNKNRLLTQMAFVMVGLIVTSPFFAANASGWSNGGFSANPASPDYGTHDWIAEHALDWLPLQEKQFILENKAAYLYGTELPDNGQAADGIGDVSKHHVYFLANGLLEDDAAAVRARDEYTKAVNAFKAGNLSGAAKELGIMAHYVADMAVFAHVMGASTAWGAEQHHSDYEDYVDTRTNSYQDTFNSYLAFDGTLSTTTAYNAALGLALDSTFDNNGDLTCVWMDTHYNWSNPTFANRAGESLNLAVNAIADVLHTFASQNVIPEFPSGILLTVMLCLALPVAVLITKKNKAKNAKNN